MPTIPTKTRRRERLCESPYVRFVNGKFQGRIWCGPKWGSVNVGLYASERAAFVAAKAVVDLMAADHVCDPITLWRATVRAIRKGLVRADVQPKYVFVRGGKFFARLGKADRNVLGPFDSAVQACFEGMDQRAAVFNSRLSDAKPFSR